MPTGRVRRALGLLAAIALLAPLAVRLSLGGAGLTWCADAPAEPIGAPPSTANADNASKFLAQRGMPPPATCPPLP